MGLYAGDPRLGFLSADEAYNATNNPWIRSRKDLVAVAFALPSLLAYVRYRRGGARAGGWYAASLLLFLLAVAAKLSVAILPVVFLVHDTLVERRSFLRSLPDKVPFLV